jgi:protein O-mannosyl-transferase
MPKKSRQHKSQVNRSQRVRSGQSVSIAPSNYKPWQIAAICVALVVITAFAYNGVRTNDFVTMDDYGYVLDNLHVHQGVTAQSTAWAFTTYDQGNWHPLTWISHMLDWSLYGRNPVGHHITNVCLHAANAVLLFLLLLYMTGYSGRSALVAFLFALHPAHVESVAWLSERKDVLCAFFWLATMLGYAWYVRKPSWKRYIWVVFGFTCALLSKPMAVSLPFALLLLDDWPLLRISLAPESRPQWLSSFWKLCSEKWLLFVMAAISSVITLFAQRSSGAVGSFQAFPLWARICNAAISYWRYIRIMLWPDPLTAYYYYDSNNISVLAATFSVIALILVTAVCWRYRKEKPYCLIGWLWFLGMLAPVIGIVQVGVQALAERYTYLPFIGLFIALVWLVGDAVANYPKIRIATQLLAVVILAVCAVRTIAQVKVWKDSATLFNHILEVDPRGGFPNYSLGVVYAGQGKPAEAQEYFERALVYDPSGPQSLSYSAYYMMQTMMQTRDMRNLPLAGKRLEEALRTSPNSPDILTAAALWSDLMDRPRDEEAYSRKAIAARPDFVAAWLYLADSLRGQGKPDEAIQAYRHALSIDPNNYDAHNSLGIIYSAKGSTDEALNEFRLSLSINPNQAMPHSRIGRILAESHRLPEAVEEFTQALRIDPANAHAHNDLGVAWIQLGDFQKAAEQFSDAVRIDPAYANARQNLAFAQAQMKSKSAQHATR